MTKLVVLKFGSGSFAQGFPVTLQIGDEGKQPAIEVAGKLPPVSEMPLYYNRWQDSYYRLGNQLRLSAATIQITNVSLIEQCVDTAKILKARLNTWLHSDEFRLIYEALLTELSRNDTVRMILQMEQGELQLLPWHLWEIMERYPKAEIALGAFSYQSPKPLSSKRQSIRILAVLGDSQGIDIVADRKLLEQLSNAEVTFLVEPQRKQLTDQLWEQAWDILFFAGHSITKDGAGKIFINQTDSLTVSELKYAVRTAVDQGLQLAIFNSCDGLGLARDLADLQIPQTIVMREPVPDRVAQEFLKYFLTTFARGESLYLSVRSARERLQGLEDKFPCATWLPVIFQNPAVVPVTWEALISPPSPRPRPSHQFKILPALLTSLVIAAIVLGVRHIGLLKFWELNLFDVMLQLRAIVKPDESDHRILVVAVDDAAIEAQKEKREALQGRSLSETTLINLLDKLQQYKPVAIGLDIYQDYPLSEKVTRRFQQMHNLIGICKVGGTKPDPHGIRAPAGIPLARIGFSDAIDDSGDKMLRRQLLFMNQVPGSPCQANYALSVQLVIRYLSAQGIEPKFTPQGYLQFNNVIFKPLFTASGGYQQQNDLGGSQVLLNFRSAEVPSVSLNQVLYGEVVPEEIKDRIVLIGATDRNSEDKWKTPYLKGNGTPEVPGVFIQAQMVSQILSAVLEQRPLLWVWNRWGEILWIAGWSLGGVAVLWLRTPAYRILGTIAALFTLDVVCFCILFFWGGWVPVIPSTLTLILTVCSGSTHEFLNDKTKNTLHSRSHT